MIKSLLIIIACALCTLPTHAQKIKPKPTTNTAAKLQTYINTIAATDTDLIYAAWSVYAIDTKTKKVIAAHNPNTSLTPASTQKIITTATAIEILGSNAKFETQLSYSGTIKNQVLSGNVYLIGKGDPCLGSVQYDYLQKHYYPTADSSFLTTFVSQIKKLGITKIEGRIIADDTYFDGEILPNTWAWGDIGNYYGAFPSGLCIYDNTYKITLRTPDLVGANTEIIGTTPAITQLKITNKSIATATTTDETYIYNAPLSYTPTIRGELPKSKNNFDIKGSLPHPAQTAAEALNNALKKQNITITLPPTTTRQTPETTINPQKIIYKYPSPSVATIATATNHKSINLFAEALLLHIGATQGKFTTHEATPIVKNYWQTKGINTKGLQMYDGSGLSAYNAVNTKFLVDVLQYMTTSVNYTDFYNTLPTGGQSGTVKNMFKNTIADGKIHLKSGSISHVRAYTGYATTQSNKNIAFAIIINNYTCTDTEARKKMEKIMLKITELQD